MSDVLLSPAAAAPDLQPGSRRMTTRDAVMRGSRIVMAVGPLHLPGRDALVRGLARLVLADPSRRIAWRSTAAGHWITPDEADLEARFEEMVVAADGLRGMTPTAAAVAARRLADPTSPVTFFIAGDTIILVADHRLCDGLLTANLIPLLLAAAAGAEPSSMLTARDTPFPLLAALKTTFARRGAIRGLLHQRRATPGTATNVQPAVGPEAELEAAASVLDCATVVIDRATFRGVRMQMREHRVSLAAMELSWWRASLAAAGIETGPAATLVVDLRRYLPRGARVLGNFVTGLPLGIAGHAVREVDVQLEEALKAGRPLAAFATGMLRRTLTPGGGGLRTPSPAITQPAHAVVSSVGQVRGLEALPWSAPPDERVVLGCVDVGQPHEITFVTMLVAGALHVTATFDASRFPRAAVERALALVAASAVDFAV